MNRSCPNCHASNVRRSSTPAAEATWRNHVFSRYRWRECLTQFWVVSRKTCGGVALDVGAIVLAAVGIPVMERVLTPDTKAPPSRWRSDAVPEQRPPMASFPLPQTFIQRASEPS